MGRPTVLFVDDDERMLNGWRRTFSQEPYHCLWARSGEEARSIVRGLKIAVVVTDYAMPNGDGLSLLRDVVRISPSTARVLVSGNANLTVAQEAINECGVQLFFQKPCSVIELGEAIRSLLPAASSDDGPEVDRRVGLADLERDHPGISRVERDERGYIKVN